MSLLRPGMTEKGQFYAKYFVMTIIPVRYDVIPLSLQPVTLSVILTNETS